MANHEAHDTLPTESTDLEERVARIDALLEALRVHTQDMTTLRKQAAARADDAATHADAAHEPAESSPSRKRLDDNH